MAQIYSSPDREDDAYSLPNIEVFYHNGVDKLDPEAATYVAGWYWWPCFPGCLPDGEPVGPFVTEAEAITDSID